MKPALIVLAAVLALAGAFVGGRFSAPLKVETRDVERVVFKDRIVEKIVTVEKAARVETKIVYRDRVITRDGTVTEHEKEITEAKENTETKTNADTVATREGETVKTVTVTTTLRPEWRVSLLAGASLQPPALTLAGPLVLGLEVDRRIVGGLSAGVWLNTYGAAGLSLSFEF